MSSVICVRNLVIGSGIPKICAPISGTTLEALMEECAMITEDCVDLIEWRADYFAEIGNIDSVQQTVIKIREKIGNIPLLFTFRTVEEGGQRKILDRDYLELLKEVVHTENIDLVDIQIRFGVPICEKLIAYARIHRVAAILSSHDFHQTPPPDEIYAIFCQMEEMGGDIAKIAVMPSGEEDVVALMSAARRFKRQFPDQTIIIVSMGPQGAVTRVLGEAMGSSVTFGALKRSSAPGQIDVKPLRDMLHIIHESLDDFRNGDKM